jgi:hypothetical protein
MKINMSGAPPVVTLTKKSFKELAIADSPKGSVKKRVPKQQ